MGCMESYMTAENKWALVFCAAVCTGGLCFILLMEKVVCPNYSYIRALLCA